MGALLLSMRLSYLFERLAFCGDLRSRFFRWGAIPGPGWRAETVATSPGSSSAVSTTEELAGARAFLAKVHHTHFFELLFIAFDLDAETIICFDESNFM